MSTSRTNEISKNLLDQVVKRLAANKPVRRTLPEGGRIHIDRQLPFIVIYRPPNEHADEGTKQLVSGQASYLAMPPRSSSLRTRTRLLPAVADTMIEAFGAFLVIEVWSGSHEDASNHSRGATPAPAFKVVVPRRDAESPSVTRLVSALGQVSVQGKRAIVELAPGTKQAPPGMPRLSASFGTAESPVRLIGIEVSPIFRDASTGDVYPELLRLINRQVSRAIQQCAYEFAIHQTATRPRHYQALGRRAFVKAVAEADRQLSKVATGFDLLLLVSPVNTDQAYRSFRRSKGTKSPVFRYRPIDVDITSLKRALYAAPVERVEDPTLAAIFSEKQRELSLKLDLLSDRLSDRFVHTGVSLYGDVSQDTVAIAKRVLEQLPPSAKGNGARSVDSQTFAKAAEVELEKYRAVLPTMTARVEVREDISSLMVSGGNVLVGASVKVPVRRVEALLQHEVGTHVVTYWNGRAQRLSLLASGLAGHDELQEGLGVMAEHLVAGLTSSRLRTLAGRVLAARSVVDGAEFIDTYRLLNADHGIGSRQAFLIAARVHRGGGLVKDAVYLRGLQQVTDYLADGRRLETLLAGKISVDHVAVIEELQRRGALTPPPLRPGYLDYPDTHYRLERLRKGIDLVDLVEDN